MGLTNFRNTDLQDLQDILGLTAIVGFTPTVTYFVDSNNGSSSYDGLSRRSPKATLAQALALCTDNRGHVVYVAPGHAETLSATTQGLAFSQSGVTIIGGGSRRTRPAITCGSADIVGVLLSGSNNTIKNMRFIGSSGQTSTGSVIVSITGTDNHIEDCAFEHGAGSLGCILMAAAHRTVLRKLRFRGTAAGPDFCIKVTGTAAPSYDCIIEDIDAQYSESSGLDSGVIISHQTTGTPGWIMDRVRGTGLDVAILDLNGSAAGTVVDSLAANIYGVFTTATSTAAAFDLGGTMLANSFWSDATAAPAMWAGVALRVAGTTGTVGAYPAAAGPT